jgi:hypothetical protein
MIRRTATFTTVLALAGLLIASAALAGEPAPQPPKPAQPETPTPPPAADDAELCQACTVLTVAEGKRLIAKAVAALPVVQKALKEGTVIVTTGTTNTYVAEELLGEKIEPGRFVTGVTYPAKGGSKLKPKGDFVPVIVFRGGKWDKDMTLETALKVLKAGDVVIKGANMLDHDAGVAGVLIGHPTAGTIGQVMPYVVARKAHLVIPVGLEKECPGSGRDIADRMREPVKTLGRMPSMFLVTGTIVTELEALSTLCGVEAFQVAAGGVGGAEGSRWILFRGTREQVTKTQEFLKGILGEPNFVK